jgi:hypothetical protein
MSIGSSLPPGAKRFAQQSAVQVGRVTAGARMLPSFLIVGGQRCGTTSMYKALTQHPAVLSAVLRKGVHYFDVNYGRSMSWYRAHFPLLATARRHRYQGVLPITGESSPYYMFHPLSAERFARDLPGVKVIVLVRDPVERAYSAFAHESARGFDTLPTFEQALEAETQRLADQDTWLREHPAGRSYSHQHHGYLARGHYVDYLERLESHLGRERVHVVDSGDFFTEPATTFDAVTSFLDLPAAPHPAFAKHNSRERSAMADPLRDELAAHFAPYDDRLEKWLGWAPSWRR